jgi:uncharacterized protein YkwD
VKSTQILEGAAQAQARDMALRDYFSHTSADGDSTWDRWEYLEVMNYGAGGEASAMGQESAQEVVSSWMGSSSHRRILMTPEYTHIGIGVYFDHSSYDYPVHVIADFAEFREDPDTTPWYERGTVN